MVDTQQNRQGAWLALAGGALLVIGSFLPWAKITAPFVGQVTKSGMDGGDGVFTAGLGGIAGLLGIAVMQSGRVSNALRIGLGIVGVLAGALTLFEILNLTDLFSEVESGFASTDYGSGLFACGLGALLVLVSAFLLKVSAPEPTSDEAPHPDWWKASDGEWYPPKPTSESGPG